MTTFKEMQQQAREIEQALHDLFPGDDPRIRQTIALAEEAGEFVGAARRFMGMARRSGSWEDVRFELADVVITAFVTADTFSIDLEDAVAAKLEIMFARGWREKR